jgi:hypothetical protein
LARAGTQEPEVGEGIHTDFVKECSHAATIVSQSDDGISQLQAFRERMMGLEPTTFCMASRRSSQLSYIREEGQYSLRFRRPEPR